MFFKLIFRNLAEMVGWYPQIDPTPPQGSTGAKSTAQVARGGHVRAGEEGEARARAPREGARGKVMLMNNILEVF